MKHPDLAQKFETVFRQLLAREQIDLYVAEMSLMWEAIADTLFGSLPQYRWHYFDGVVDLCASFKTQRQIEFTGNMWVGNDLGKQWTEKFRARVTDKTSSKQGIWIVAWVGEKRAEAELGEAFRGSRSRP